jgi:hypothetical protein
MATHKYILSAGHRNTNRGGASNEINWTFPSCLAIKRAIERRGGKAWIVQQMDGDSDPTFYTAGGLQQAASHCVKLSDTYGPFDAYLSSHYNGGASPGFHAIYPDASGLSPGSSVDVATNNSRDIAVAVAIRDAVKATNTVGMLNWTRHSPGVMNEDETGVGAKGYRLGEFVGTLGFRDETTRTIIEAGSIDVARERAFINDPTWVNNVYAEAVVNGLETVFGKMGNVAPPLPPVPPDPPTTYPAPLAIPELDKYKSGDVSTIPALIPFGTGYVGVWVGDRAKAVRQTARLRHFDGRTDERVGPDVTAGLVFDVDWLILKPGDASYVALYRTAYGTFIRQRETIRVGDDRKIGG